MSRFEQELIERTARAVSDIDEGQCEARPDAETCCYCEVRQLCNAYWSSVVSSQPVTNNPLGDVEAELIDVLSPKSWRIKVGAGSTFLPGTTALLRGSLPENLAQIGSIIRVLNARFISPSIDQSSDEIPVIQMLAQSEVFIQSCSPENM